MIRTSFYIILLITIIVLQTQCNTSNGYTGKPFADANYNGGPQPIPGRIQCEYYDFGGEGIAYHDSDSTNSGSGGLNPLDGSYLNEFRKGESVDISYTKITDNQIDNNPYNLVEPEKEQLYVGWTEPGEWMKYTVQVQQSGKYKVGLMYTSNRGGEFSLLVNDKDATGPIDLPTTFVQADTLQWRQWHHWNYINDLASIELEKGIQHLTLSVLTEGNINFEHLDFTLTE